LYVVVKFILLLSHLATDLQLEQTSKYLTFVKISKIATGATVGTVTILILIIV
jgi:hypothetical protein